MWTFATNDIDGSGTVDADEVHDSGSPLQEIFHKQVMSLSWDGYPGDDPAGNNGRPHGIAMNQTETVAELRFCTDEKYC